MTDVERLRHEIEVLEAWAPKLIGVEWENHARRGSSNRRIDDLDFHLRSLRGKLKRLTRENRENATRFVSQNL